MRRECESLEEPCQAVNALPSSRYAACAFARKGRVSETEPIIPFRPRPSGAGPEPDAARGPVQRPIAFDRTELNLILGVYGSKVAEGEWRDYALDFSRDSAIFSVFRRTSEMPLYRIVKDPQLARKQGAYAVFAQGGMILRRGHDLAQVLRVLIRKPRLRTV